MAEKWSAGEDEETRGDYSVAGINVKDDAEPSRRFENTHFNAIECYGCPIEVARANRPAKSIVARFVRSPNSAYPQVEVA